MCSQAVLAGRTASIHDEARREAQRHKWIESQKHGRDLGDQAIRDWYRKYWRAYCRHRRIEHLRGRKRWAEFDDEPFGKIDALIASGDSLVDRCSIACTPDARISRSSIGPSTGACRRTGSSISLLNLMSTAPASSPSFDKPSETGNVSAGLRTVSLSTVASRVLGLVRDVAMAAAFGNGPLMDAFSVAFRVPGWPAACSAKALTAAFLPAFLQERTHKGPEAGCAWRVECWQFSPLDSRSSSWQENCCSFSFGSIANPDRICGCCWG